MSATTRVFARPHSTLVAAVPLLVTALVSIAAHSQPGLPRTGGGAGGYATLSPQLGASDPLFPQGGQSVAFPSPQPEGATLSIPAVLFRPTGAAKGAVVVVNATPGWSDYREGHYGRALSSAGYAVLAIDTYGPRQVTYAERDNAKLSTYAQALDAFAARKYLISLGYAADHMAVMGTGRGGTIALLAADRTFMRSEKDRFVLAMSISAGCIFQPRRPSPGSRIFMAIGEKDQISGVEPCRSLAEKYVAAGGHVTVKLYAGAPRGFDGHPDIVKLYHDPTMETFVDCTVLVEPDGRSSYVGKTFAESDTKGLMEEMRKSCIRRGGSGWTNLTQKANLTLDLIEFLDLNFRF
jgi:dienelactone hydrolase